METQPKSESRNDSVSAKSFFDLTWWEWSCCGCWVECDFFVWDHPISEVSARLLAQLDVKLRSVVRDLAWHKRDGDQNTRPFGGLNVLCSGDFWQLDPPDNGSRSSLADIPVEFIRRARKYAPAPTVSHGQSLFWAGAKCGMQGVMELVERERCKDERGQGEDPWLLELQDQFRNGCLSEDNWKFLHGKPTRVPGSWAAGTVQCGNAACAALADPRAASSARSEVTKAGCRKKASVNEAEEMIKSKECERCRQARDARIRVATRRQDAPFDRSPFNAATAIFPKNDVKYATNKTRARLFAARRNVGLVYSIAKDKPSQTVLRERPGLVADKIKWLQRHDRESGDLYGMLPLIENMPVALTDHIDRNPEKRLLRGRVGFVHSWVLDDKETGVMENGVQRLQFLPQVGERVSISYG